MTDLRPKTDNPDRMNAPGVGSDPSSRTVPKGPAGASPQPKGTDPVVNPSGNTDTKDPMRVSTQPKP